MTQRENPDLNGLITGALDWWRDAGVDYAFLDEPIQWERPPEPVLVADDAPAPVIARAFEDPDEVIQPAPLLDKGAFPATFKAFSAWWLEEPLLADGPIGTRIAPRGMPEAELMVIVPEPEAEDRDTLLSGPQGRLLDAMLNAFGISPDQTYFASALPRNLPGADWEELTKRGIGNVLLHHIELVRPKRIAVFGANILPLISHNPPQAPADLRIFHHEGMNRKLLACRSLAAFLEQPRWKARIWQAWMDMIA